MTPAEAEPAPRTGDRPPLVPDAAAADGALVRVGEGTRETLPAPGAASMPLGPSGTTTPGTAGVVQGGPPPFELRADLPDQVRTSPLEHRRETVAAVIVSVLLAALLVSLFGPLVGFYVTGRALPAELQGSLDTARVALVGLFGTVLGFYFSDKRLK